MPFTYNKDPEERHGTRHHVFLNVDYDEHDATCVCGEKTVLTLALINVKALGPDFDGLEAWLDSGETNEECADEARKELGLTRSLMELPGVTPARAHRLREAGYESHFDLRSTPPWEIEAEAGLPQGLVDEIVEAAGGRYPEYREEWEVLE